MEKVNQYMECSKSEDEAVDVEGEESKSLKEDLRSSRRSSVRGFGRNAIGLLPILNWLPKYNVKENLHGDLIAGLTVGIMHVPQGMAYASLAAVPPIVGLYSSFFASTFYMLFGTSRHISVGCFAVASMMVGAVQLRLLPGFVLGSASSNHSSLSNQDEDPWSDVTPLELTSALTFAVGIVQMVMALSRLGFITEYLSDPLISGFTTGSAVHVLMSQANKVFGVKMPLHSGMGMIIFMVRDIISEIPHTNLMSLSISLFGMMFLSLGRDYLNPLVKKYSRVPLPLELILVIIGTIFSVGMNLKEDYHIKVVDSIPKGFPAPSLPRFSLLIHLIADAIPIAVICYIFVISMAKLFAKKHKYRVDSVQEMYAVSFYSLLSSFFPVYPVGASLSRSAVCEMSGAKTLLYTVFSSLLLLTVILFIGPLLEPLPMCILACIVIVSLKSLFKQVTELPRLWKISKFDFAVWVVTCLATVLCSVTQGLVVGVAFSILTVVLREQWPSFSDAPHIGSSVYHSLPERARILKFDSPLHFANVSRFNAVLEEEFAQETSDEEKVVVVDCAAVSYIDSMAVDALKEKYEEARRARVTLIYVGFNDQVLRVLDSIDFHSSVPMSVFHPTVAHALDFALTV